MHAYFIYGLFLCLSVWNSIYIVVDTLGPSHINLEEELSTGTFLVLDNFSYVKSKLTYQDHLQLKSMLESEPLLKGTKVSSLSVPSRRDLRRTYNPRSHNIPSYTGQYSHGYEATVMRMCYLLSNTYKASVTDLEYYYPLRYFYRNVRDFEIGYLTYDIIHTYSNILELYHMMVYQYEMQNFTYFAPLPYMFYIYTNMVLLGKHLTHQCNMIAEIENKYKGAIALFNDTTTTPLPEAPDLSRVHDTPDSVNIMINITEEKRKERQRDRKKDLKELFKGKFIGDRDRKVQKHLKDRGQRKPFRSKWPLKYGWSIEESWKGYSYWSGYFNFSSEFEDEEFSQNKYLENHPNQNG